MNNNYSTILEDNIARRTEHDLPLINFLILFLLCGLSIVGAIIASQLVVIVFPELNIAPTAGAFLGLCAVLCLVYLQNNRVNIFIKRKAEWYTNIVEFTKQHSEDSEKLQKLKTLMDSTKYRSAMNPINLINSLIMMAVSKAFGAMSSPYISETPTLLSFSICLVVIALWVGTVIVYEYPMNAIWNKIQCFENEFDDTLSKVWKENRWIENPIEFYTDPSKKRNYYLWAFFSIITCGIMYVIWKYKIYTDPDNMYYRFHDGENRILEVIKKIEQQQKLEIENQK